MKHLLGSINTLLILLNTLPLYIHIVESVNYFICHLLAMEIINTMRDWYHLSHFYVAFIRTWVLANLAFYSSKLDNDHKIVRPLCRLQDNRNNTLETLSRKSFCEFIFETFFLTFLPLTPSNFALSLTTAGNRLRRKIPGQEARI